MMQDTLTRRAFVAGGLTAGFALAVQPVSADTITTDTAGLTAGEVRFRAMDGKEIPAYRAMPETGGPFPVVLVIQEIFGVHEHIKDVCRRFAKRGYFAIAPELFFRQGDVSKAADFQAIIRDVVSKVPDVQVMTDLDAVVAYAKTMGKADTANLAVTGFCWGGRITWLYAAHNRGVKAGGAWYGRLVGQANPLQDLYPVDIATHLSVPVLGLYGGKDEGIPLATVEQMRTTLAQGKSGSEVVVYPDAGHGFYADYRPSYNEAVANVAFKRLLDWFNKHGVGNTTHFSLGGAF